jgi:hypothetical protein
MRFTLWVFLEESDREGEDGFGLHIVCFVGKER